jgi:hypothetical protein
MKQKDLKLALFLSIIALIVTAFMPYLLTRSLGLTSFIETGPIGDTIGGITAPFTNIIGSVLVFFALKAQIASNEMTRKQFEQQSVDEFERKNLIYISEQLNIIRQDINDFRYTYTITKRENTKIVSKEELSFKGSSAISSFIGDLKHFDSKHNEDSDVFESNSKVAELYHLLIMINSLLNTINKHKLSENDFLYFKSIISYQYFSKIRPAFKSNEKFRQSNMEACRSCGEKHAGIPEELFTLVDSIEEKIKA